MFCDIIVGVLCIETGFIMKEKETAKKGITEIKIKEAVNITGKSRGWVIRTLQRELFKMNNQPERSATTYINNSFIQE